MTHNVYREGRVHVLSEMCKTCVFRPGNLMDLEPGRVAGMVREARANDSTIVCHSTLDEPDQAACRGFFDRHKTAPLQVAERMDLITFVEEP